MLKKKSQFVKASFYYCSYSVALLVNKEEIMFRRGKVYMEELKRGGCEKSEEREGKRRKNEVSVLHLITDQIKNLTFRISDLLIVLCR